MEFMNISRALQGWRIYDSISGKQGYYITPTLKEAIKEHRRANGLRYKHLTKFYY